MVKIMKNNAELRMKRAERKENNSLDESDMFYLSMSKTAKKLSDIEQARIRMELCRLVSEAQIREVQNQTSGQRHFFPSPNHSSFFHSSQHRSQHASQYASQHTPQHVPQQAPQYAPQQHTYSNSPTHVTISSPSPDSHSSSTIHSHFEEEYSTMENSELTFFLRIIVHFLVSFY